MLEMSEITCLFTHSSDLLEKAVLIFWQIIDFFDLLKANAHLDKILLTSTAIHTFQDIYENPRIKNPRSLKLN